MSARTRRHWIWTGGIAALALAAPSAAVAGPPVVLEAEPFTVDDATLIGVPAATNGINGIYVSPADGYLYAASVGGDEITVHHPRTGAVVDRLGRDDGVNGPDDLFITDDGTIYWTEILTGFVGRRTAAGVVTRQFVGPGVNPITMSDDGRLFVNRIFIGQGLYELDPDLVAPPTELNGDLLINGFDFGPDGHLYAPSFFTGEVLKIDVDDPTDVEVVADGFGIISALKFNSRGIAHLVGLGEGTVTRLDLVGGDHTVIVDIPGTIDNIAFDARDTLYAAAGADNQLIRRTRSGRVSVLGPLGLGLPGGVAVSDDGTVWISELFALRGYSTELRSSGLARLPVASFYDRFSPPGTFGGSTTVSADGDQLILGSGFANAVQVFDPATGDVSLDVRTLAGVTNAIRHDGEIVATQLFVGNVVAAEDPTDVLIEGLAVPVGLATDGDTLYVSDWATGLVWAVGDGAPVPIADGLVFPEGIAVDGDRLLVVETGRQRVIGIDLATLAVSEVVVGLDYSDTIPEGFFPFGALSGVAVGPDNAIVVSDDGVNSVYRFERP